MADKEVGGMLAALAGSRILGDAQLVATGVPDTSRSLPAAELARAWEVASGRPADAISDDADAALEHALALATAVGGPLLVAGSLYLVGHLRARLVPGTPGIGDA
jgi:folylpolyglutamate synthase/dihydropteroate synthase